MKASKWCPTVYAAIHRSSIPNSQFLIFNWHCDDHSLYIFWATAGVAPWQSPFV